MKLGKSNILQSEKFLGQRRKKRIIIGVVIFLCILSIIFFVITLLRNPFFKITNFEITGVNSVTDIEELKIKAQKSLEGKFLNFIPKSTIFTYSPNNMQDNIIRSSPKIVAILVKTKGISTIQIDIQERVPVAIGCEGFKDDTIQDDNTDDLKCFLLDELATVFDEYSKDFVNSFTKYYLNSNAEPIKIGSFGHFIDPSVFSELQKMTKKIKDAGVSVKGLLIGDDGSYEMYIRNSDYSTAVVYFDDRVSFDSTYSNFITFWNNSSKKDFDYINLRFGNNIFFTNKSDINSQ